MEQAGVKAVLSSTSIINKWEEPSCSDLSKLVDSIRNVKQSVNDYLTDLASKEKGSVDKCQKSIKDSDEGEEDAEDTISGFIKKAAASEKMKKGNKRKVQASAELQKPKKRK